MILYIAVVLKVLNDMFINEKPLSMQWFYVVRCSVTVTRILMLKMQAYLKKYPVSGELALAKRLRGIRPAR